MTPFRLYHPDELGPDGYPLAWHRLPDLEPAGGVKDLVRMFAGHRCVRCGHPYLNGTHGGGEWSPCWEHCTHPGPVRGIYEGERYTPIWDSPTTLNDPALLGIEAQWRILTVHHLNGNKADLRWWNLCALCQRCHLTIQGTVVMERVWPFEHDDWFKPYAAGWYAHSYLNEDLTREETMARLDELLALERMA